ncbi:TLC domain-containing protein 2 [Pyrus ussuriensis x Pyrus communis]|uniref:TLC domain-containing protein 2 n=1 Tax=Pyrus ussuriensis x Pyrus communis TaxID=2448454 RepID=A0A5N5HMT6_9ROSA|nr:TLC domain-containing protein 2 [Pyrus ussuriensis x Pyrus communis]
MSRTTRGLKEDKAGPFFLATLLLWFVSVLFEILFHRRSELLAIVAGCFFYQLANWVVRSFVSRDPLFVNTSVSLLHSSITSASVVFILVNQCLRNGSVGMFEHSELVGRTWPWAYPALCFSCGYFAYDQCDMLHYGLYSGWIPSILMHHLVLLIYLTLALYQNVTINSYSHLQGMLNYLLNVRKAWRMAGIRDARSKIIRGEWVLNWVTFTFARTAAHLLITGIELPLALFGMFGMNFLNASLGIDLFHAFKREEFSAC